jgi:hypothetical protein
MARFIHFTFHHSHGLRIRTMKFRWITSYWYGHVKRMDPTRLPKIMINWKPEGRKKRGRPRRTWKDGIYTAISDRDLRMGEWNNRRQWNKKVGRRRQTF